VRADREWSDEASYHGKMTTRADLVAFRTKMLW
jgi:hypothetical protein